MKTRKAYSSNGISFRSVGTQSEVDSPFAMLPVKNQNCQHSFVQKQRCWQL